MLSFDIRIDRCSVKDFLQILHFALLDYSRYVAELTLEKVYQCYMRYKILIVLIDFNFVVAA